jgi:single-stranded-DNA-specific exonuclease
MPIRQLAPLWLPREDRLGLTPRQVVFKATQLTDALKIDPLLARLLVLRGQDDPESAKLHLYGNLSDLPDPFLLQGMDKAAQRIARAIEAGESGCVMGDYDQDGIGAAAMVAEFYREIGGQIDLYIPSRFTEGYGLSAQAIRQAAARGVSYIVSVDCGISNHEEAILARDLGISLIVTDHHQVPPQCPEAFAIVNPHLSECRFPFKDLCGAGVAFFLLAAVRKVLRERGYFQDRSEPDLRKLLDICSVSTIADLVPLVGINRIITQAGLKVMGQGKRVGIEALREVANIKRISSGTVSFGLAPRLNAAGRLSDANLGANLLLETDPDKARAIASELDSINRERQQIESEILDQALEKIAAGEALDRSIVLADERWNEGVIGIVASRLVERFHLPTVLIALKEDQGKGSCRSISGFNLFENLQHCASTLIGFGGHAMAAGLKICRSDIPAFAAQLNARVKSEVTIEGLTPKFYYDAELAAGMLSEELVALSGSLEPFGMSNPGPVYLMRNVTAANVRALGQDRKHLKFEAIQGSTRVDAIAFQKGHLASQVDGVQVDLLFQAGINEYGGRRSLQLEVKDMRPSRKAA